MSKKLKGFWAGFFLSIVAICGICGFIMVDYATDKYGYGLMPSMVEIEKNSQRIGVYFLGSGIAIDTDKLNKGVGIIQKYYTVFIPAPVRLLWQTKEIGDMSIKKIYEIKLEKEWKENAY